MARFLRLSLVIACVSALSSTPAATKRVLVPVADGTEEIEVVTVVDVLRRAGADVTLASVEDDRAEVVCSRGVRLVADALVKEASADGVRRVAAAPRRPERLSPRRDDDAPGRRAQVTGRTGPRGGWDLIAIPGGMPGSERIRDSVRLHPTLEKHWRALRPIAGICAAPAVLFEPKGFLEGIAATSHPAFVDEIGGSLEETAPYVDGRVIWDANVITSRGPGTALEWSLCCVEALFGKEKAIEVAGPMVVQPPVASARRPFEWRLERDAGGGSRVDKVLAGLAPAEVPGDS